MQQKRLWPGEVKGCVWTEKTLWAFPALKYYFPWFFKRIHSEYVIDLPCSFYNDRIPTTYYISAVYWLSC